MKTKKIPVPENWKDLKAHPLATLVPYGQGIDTPSLAAHMRKYGYDNGEPIVLFDGMILDGRHKHVGAQEADVTPTFAAFVGTDAVAFVRKKILRQHLNESQRAMFAAGLLKMASQTAEKAGKNDELANLPTSQDAAAKALNVSPRSVQDAVQINNNASEAIKKQVASGEVSVSKAATVVKTIFCDRCNRTGPQRNCAKCEALRLKAAKAKTPRARPKPLKPRVGSEKFNWREFDSHFGHVARGPDKLAAAYEGEKKSDEYKECDEHLRAFRKVWEKWQKRLAKVKD